MISNEDGARHRCRHVHSGWLRALVAAFVLTATFGAEAATPVGASTDSTPAGTVVLPVKSCPTSFGTTDKNEPWHPAKLLAVITKSEASNLSFYSDGFFTVLGPKGWECQGMIYGDGAQRFVVSPPGQVTSSPYSTLSRLESITVGNDSSGHGPGANFICPYFPNSPAARFFPPTDPLACPGQPAGAKVTYATPDVARIQGPTSRVGVAIYPQVTPPPSGVAVAVETCLLKGIRKALCDPILADFVVRGYPSERRSSPY